MKITFSPRTLDFYYVFMFGLYILTMFIPGIRFGVVASIVICVFIIEYFVRNSFIIRRSMDLLILTYILFNTASFFWFLISGLPISVFIREYSNSILPVFFYYFANTEKKQSNNFYRVTQKAIVISFTIGFVLFITQPYFYRVYLTIIDSLGATDIAKVEYFRGVTGITSTASLGVIGILLSFKTIFDSKGRRGKIVLFMFMAAVSLTLRRSALVMAIFSLLYMHYIGYTKYKFLKTKHLIVEVVIIILPIIFIVIKYQDLIPDLYDRLLMIPEAIAERSDRWIEGLKYGNLIIGSGLGVFGHKAVEYTDKIIPDGNYFRMLAELGIIGTFIFISIIYRSLLKGIKNLKDNYLEVGIIIVICVQAIGSDLFSFQIIMPIFWYSIGRIQHKEIFK